MPVSPSVVYLLQTSLDVEPLNLSGWMLHYSTLQQLVNLLQDQLSQLGRVNFGKGFAFNLTDFQ